MWVILDNSFLSIVDKVGDPNNLMVRARAAGDIERVFPEAEVIETPFADYRFRTTLPRNEIADAIALRIMDIDYPNFKNSVNEDDRHDAYMQVWTAMHKFQSARVGKRLVRQTPPLQHRQHH